MHSKLSVYSNQAPATLLDDLTRANPPVVAIEKNTSLTAELTKRLPDIRILFRVVENEVSPTNAAHTPEEWAAIWLHGMQTYIDGLRGAGADMRRIYFQACNEPGDGRKTARAVNRFVLALCSLMGDIRLAGMSWSVGCPDYPYWDELLPALRAMAARGDLLVLHEYAGPGINKWDYGTYTTPQGILQGHYFLRHRWVYHEVLVPNGIDLEIILGELGFDYDCGPNSGPWQSIMSVEELEQALPEMDALLCEYRCVVGATWYVDGTDNWYLWHLYLLADARPWFYGYITRKNSETSQEEYVDIQNVIKALNDIKTQNGVVASENTKMLLMMDALLLYLSENATPAIRYTVTTRLRMRAKPDVSGAEVIVLDAGAVVTEIDANHISSGSYVWAHVTDGTHEGYCAMGSSTTVWLEQI